VLHKVWQLFYAKMQFVRAKSVLRAAASNSTRQRAMRKQLFALLAPMRMCRPLPSICCEKQLAHDPAQVWRRGHGLGHVA
jgi:hypothetical protein